MCSTGILHTVACMQTQEQCNTFYGMQQPIRYLQVKFCEVGQMISVTVGHIASLEATVIYVQLLQVEVIKKAGNSSPAKGIMVTPRNAAACGRDGVAM